MADNALIQSGLNLAKATAAANSPSNAFAEGVKAVRDEITKNEDRAFQLKKREYEMARLEDEKFLREQNIERGLMQYEAEKGAAFAAIDEAIKQGTLSPVDYQGFLNNREAWWKDQANRLKTAQDLPTIKANLKLASTAEANWQNVLGFAQGVNISDSSGQAQRMDMAIDRWAKENGTTTPPIEEVDGQLQYVLPSADGSEKVYIPLKNVGRAKGAQDIYGQYNERKTFSGVQANFISSKPQLDQIFRNGRGTQQQLNQAIAFFEQQIESPEQLTELLDDLLMTPGVDKEALGIKEAGDIDANGNGIIDGNERDVLKSVFSSVLSAHYGEQDFDRPGNNNYTEAQVQTYNATNELLASQGTNLNALQSLPGVFDTQIDRENNRAILFIGDDRNERNAYVLELDPETGAITPNAFDKLRRKFGYVDLNPQAENEPVAEETPAEDTVVEETPVEETPVEETPAEVDNRSQFEKQGAVIENGKLVEKGTLSGTQVKEINKALNLSKSEISEIQNLVKDRGVSVDENGEIASTGSASSREMRRIENLMKRIELYPEEGITIFPKGFSRTRRRRR